MKQKTSSKHKNPEEGQERLFGRQHATYTAFDKLRTLEQGNYRLAVDYGIDRQRVRQTFRRGSSTRAKRHFTPLYESITENGVTKNLHYLTARSGLFAIFATQTNGASAMYYTLKDHLGSWTTITDANGNVEREQSYDAWGNMRNPETWLNYTAYEHVAAPMFDRGFILHEHYDDFNLINMNGRCYDPVTSSFLSVDRFVQSPDNSQGFNRYAYCMYNPLRYIDPSGWVISRPERNGILPPPDGSDFDNYVPGRITSDGFSTEYNAYTYSYNMYEVTVTASRYTWAEQWCRDYTWNRRGTYSSEYSGGEVIVPNGGAGGFTGASFNNSSIDKIDITVQSLNVSNGLKTELIDAAVRYNYKTDRTWLQWNTNLRDGQKAWRRVTRSSEFAIRKP